VTFSGSGKNGIDGEGDERGGGAPVAVEDGDDGDVDSGRLRDVFGVQEEEGETARRFLALAWLGVEHSLVYVELRESSMAARCGRKQRGRKTAAGKKGVGFSWGGRRSL
jgi:hypothetical protein